MADIHFYHKIDLPDGTTTPGWVDHRGEPAVLGIDGCQLLRGARVLDVGALDGFWAFWAEQQGASDVLAIDVETYDKYDWGHAGPDEAFIRQEESSGGITNKGQAFGHIRERLGSKVRRELLSVYDLDPDVHGQFDLAMFYGVLYHLRHPLLSIDRLRRVCRGAMILETHICPWWPLVPQTLFYEDDVLDESPTNWTGPTESCVASWMKSAGFWPIFTDRRERRRSFYRQRFVGVVDGRWEGVFADNPNFVRCDERYFRDVREQVATLLAGRTVEVDARSGRVAFASELLTGRAPVTASIADLSSKDPNGRPCVIVRWRQVEQQPGATMELRFGTGETFDHDSTALCVGWGAGVSGGANGAPAEGIVTSPGEQSFKWLVGAETGTPKNTPVYLWLVVRGPSGLVHLASRSACPVTIAE